MIRKDSLFKALTAEQRDEILELCILAPECGLEDAVKLLEQWGKPRSISAVSRFVRRWSLEWKLRTAREKAEATRDALPSDSTAETARGIAQQQYQLSFEELTAKEVVALKRVELAERRLALDERRVALLEAKIAEATKVTENPKLTPAEQLSRYREIFGLSGGGAS